jgi:hypothetical protein
MFEVCHYFIRCLIVPIDLKVLTFFYLLFIFSFPYPLCMSYSLFFGVFYPTIWQFQLWHLVYMFSPFIPGPMIVTLLSNSHSLHGELRFCTNSLWRSCSNGCPNGTMMDEMNGVRKPATVDVFFSYDRCGNMLQRKTINSDLSLQQH